LLIKPIVLAELVPYERHQLVVAVLRTLTANTEFYRRNIFFLQKEDQVHIWGRQQLTAATEIEA
jgi:hypothetical protein